jgi:hypothetical protein
MFLKTSVAVLAGVAVAASSLSPVLASEPVDVVWSAAQNLSSAGQNVGSPQVASSADGTRLTAIWDRYDGTVWRVQTASSGDIGSTWTTPRNLSAEGRNAEAPQIASSADGTRLTAVWFRNDGTHYRIQAASSSDAGATWTTPTTLSDAGQDAYGAQVAGSADGTRLTAIWRRSDGTNYLVQTASSSDAGATWSSPQSLSQTGQTAGYPRVASSADGTRVTAVWSRADGTNWRIQTTSSADAGSTWTTAKSLSLAGQTAGDPQVTSSADGTRLTAIWRRSDGGTTSWVQTAKSSDAGTTWTTPITLSGTGEDVMFPQITSSDNGNRLTAIWSGASGTAWSVQTASSSDAGATWTTPQTLSQMGQDYHGHRLAASADGTRVTGVWSLDDGTDWRVQTASSSDTGATWTTPQTLSDPGQNADSPQVVTSSDGRRPMALWWRWDGTARRVQAASGVLSTTPGAPTAVTAAGGDRRAVVSWTPPGDDGNAPITGYTATAAPGGQGCVTAGTGCTITGLKNGVTYTVTVTAGNRLGTGPASTPSNPVTPTAAITPKTRVIAKPKAGRSKLKVRVKPNLGKKKQWTFVVKQRRHGKWRTLKTKSGKVKVYATRGPKHIRVINLGKGKYKARSRALRGYRPDTSKVVKLTR